MLQKYAREEKSPKLKESVSLLSSMGISLTKSDGEYRVNFKGGKEETAYYTNDILDAINTGKAMLKQKKQSETILGKMINKYAQNFDNIDDMQSDLQGQGYDSGMTGEDKNPYDPSSPEGQAWSQGWHAAISSTNQNLPDAGF